MKNLFETDFETDVLTIEETDINKKIIVYNDEVNSFQHVINCLMKYCKHDIEQAEQCAWIIHTKGKCSIKEGTYDNLKPMKEALTENGISAKIE